MLSKQKGFFLGPLTNLIKCFKRQSCIPHVTAGGRRINLFRLGFHMRTQHVAKQLKIPWRHFLFLGSDNSWRAVALTQDLWSTTQDPAEPL